MTSANFEYLSGYKLRKKVRAVIVSDSGEFLFIQPHGYDTDTWTLVGGGVESGESEEQAIVREIREETGIETLLELKVSSANHWFCFSEKIKNQRKLDYDGQIARIFFATVSSDSRVNIQAEEINAYCWAPFKSIADLVKVPEQKNLVEEVVLEFGNQPAMFKALPTASHSKWA